MIMIAVLLYGLAPSWNHAYPQFANQIPNGQAVPNPNPQGGIWAGVGHLKAGGGGPLNPFGEAFRANQFAWTEDLCRADSDGDGRTNGAELGDPDCVWMAGGDHEPVTPASSHPGIVDEPLQVAPKTSCSDYKQPQDAIEYDIKFSQPVSINTTRTHYICQQMEQPVPSPAVFHKIKSSILLDNSKILHHLFVYFCFTNATDGNRVGQGPYECGGAESRCTRMAGWAVGPEDHCLPSYLGEEVDFTGMETVVVKVEAHYDNASGMSQQDQSGIRLVLTPELRPISAATTILGMVTVDNNFVLPPKQSTYAITNMCPSEATVMLPHPIYAYAFAPHMHLYGRSLFTEHYRCGVKIGEIGRVSSYEFDNQQNYALPEPVKILPGDALITTCDYNTTSLDVALVGGEETTAEMYSNFRVCTSFENGLALDRLKSFQINGVENRTTQQLSLMAKSRFAFVRGGNGAQKLVLQFESDPAKSSAACCDTNSCEEQYMASAGGVCGNNGDCAGDLVCLSGFCYSKGLDVGWAAPFVGATAALLLMCFYNSFSVL